METPDTTLELLLAQERALGERILELEEAMLTSSTPGIREFRRTRLLQLEGNRLELGDRLRRLESSPMPAVEAHMLGTALRDATLTARETFGVDRRSARLR